MYQPLSYLTTGYPKDVKHFVEHNPDWMRYPNSHVVVGHSAVDAFLQAQAKKDLLEDGKVRAEGIKMSWAMLASASLHKLGYGSSIGKHGDLVHRASIEGLADIVASGLGYSNTTATTNFREGNDSTTMRRLAGVDFDLRADAQTVGVKAADRVLSDEKRASLYDGLLYGDRDHIEAYLTETAGKFMSHLHDTK